VKGAFSQNSYIEITNNNQNPACFRVYCSNDLNFNDGLCSPRYEDDYWFCVEGNSKKIQEIRMHAFIVPLTRAGSYSGSINIELVKYWDWQLNDYITKGSLIKAYPLTINVYNNLN
jgi:hypothetical protein